eukprot:TRINITY_DN9850_c0_g1_i2.p1 TRINITY_DN9850_c0_g1~~TRINITY_DN9850_c0_g1_i2.p1  ORF type:complete len:548 (+),score=103.57 TRINITY_DN9850_c0_g1_i2:462-2105(+)
MWVPVAKNRSASPWSWVVLIMDMFLALNVPWVYQRVTLSLTAVYILVVYAESGYRLGLFDIEGFIEEGGLAAENCECTDPPCGIGMNVFVYVPCVLIILFGDFFCTRNFASGLRSEQAKVLAAVEVADQVAASLAGFDLATAEVALDNAGSALPPRLAQSFSHLLRNLASYRPYLPQSCFEQDGGADSSPRGSAASSQCLAAEQLSFASRGGISADHRPPGGSFNTQPRRSIASSVALSATDRSSRTGSEHEAPAREARTAHAPQHRRVTLLHWNSSGLLAALRETGEMNSWLSEAVERFSAAVRAQGGVAELLSGDHHSASFGALKAQGTQRTSATGAAVALSGRDPAGLCHTAAVCHGRALCGDFGSAAAQRFMVIGGVSAFVVAEERAAAAWRVGVLIDAAVHADAEMLWSCRLRKRVSFPKFSQSLIGLWEVLGERLGERGPDEWMYELENAQPNPWRAYNDAVGRWCDGAVEQALGLIADALTKAGPDCDPAVRDALLAARELAQEGAEPPVGQLTAAALAGCPAPLAPRNVEAATEVQGIG